MPLRFSVLPLTFRRSRFVLILALVLLTPTMSVVEAQNDDDLPTSVWIGGISEDWFDADNWDPAIIPGGLVDFPANDVVINGSQGGVATVRFSENVDAVIRNLSLGLGDRLLLGNEISQRSGLSITGSFSPDVQDVLLNQGTISLETNSDVSSLSNSSLLELSGDIDLTGGGTIQLTNSGLVFHRSFFDDPVVNNVDNQILGSGEIDLTNVDSFTNSADGLIAANQIGSQLRITRNRNSSSSVDFTNEGTLRAVNGGRLTFDIDVANAGTIEALEGSTVVLEDGASVTGGFLNTSGSGTIEISPESVSRIVTSERAEVAFRDVTIDATVNVQQSVSLNLQGVIENRQSITTQEEPNFFDPVNAITTTGNVTLTGNGTIGLAGVEINGNFEAGTLTNVDNTIQGAGVISGDFVNEAGGLVVANRFSEELSTRVFNGQSTINRGTFQAENGGVLNLRGGFGDGFVNEGVVQALDDSRVNVSNLSGGILRSVGSGDVVILGRIADLNLDGTITALGDQIVAEGGIVNGGILNVGGQIGGDSILAIRGDVRLSGGGTVVLNSVRAGESGISDTSELFNQPAGSSVLTNVDNTIRGSGFIGAERLQVINETDGTIEAAGSLRLSSSTTEPFVNRGELRAGVGSTLFLGGSEFFSLTSNQINNEGGLIEAVEGGQVDLTSSAITGGTIGTVGDGLLTVRGDRFRQEDVARISDAVLGGNVQFGAVDIENQFVDFGGQLLLERVSIAEQELNFTSVDDGFSSVGSISFVGDTSLAGGTVRLAGDNIVISDSVAEVGDFSNVNNTIEGFGIIDYRRQDFVNESGSLIDANVDQRRLNFSTGTVDNQVINRGVLRASNGGELVISGVESDFGSQTLTGVLDNAGGRIEALAGSTISVRGLGIVDGGEIVGDENSRLVLGSDRFFARNQSEQGSLRDLTLDLAVEIAEQANFGFEGQIVNRQSIDVSESSNLIVDGDTTFSGGGTIQLNGSSSFDGSINTNSTQSITLTNTDNIIQGFGAIGSFDSPSNINIVNEAGGVIQANVENETLEIGGDIFSPFAFPTLVNRGLLLASNGGTLVISSELVNDGIIEAEEASTVAGFINNGVDGTLRGDGTIGGIFTVVNNEGTIAPGVSSAGNLTLDGNVVLTETSVLEIDLFGAEDGDFDVLEVGGALDLGGLLSVDLADFTPTLEDEFRVITALDFAGSFDAFSLGEFQRTTDGQFEFLVSLDESGAAPSLLLSNFQTVAVPEPNSAVLVGLVFMVGLSRRRRS